MQNVHKIKIDQANGSSEPELNLTVKVIIDLEDLCIQNKPHPDHDPGIVIHYLIKVDETRHEIAQSKVKGHEIFVLSGKDPQHFRLLQVYRESGESRSRVVSSHETVDLSTNGIERFITERITTTFFIDKKRHHAQKSCLSVREILVDYAKVNPELKTLALKQDCRQFNDLDEIICLEQDQCFTLFDNSPTPVS